MAVLLGLGCTLRSLPLETPCLQLGTKGLDLRGMGGGKVSEGLEGGMELAGRSGPGVDTQARGMFQILPGWPGQGPRRALAQRRRLNRAGSRTPQSQIFTYYIGGRKLLGASVSHQ